MKYAEMKNMLMMVSDPVQKLEMVMDFGKQMPVIPKSANCYEILGCASHAEICID